MPKNKVPKHIAIIMDGNGRWAKQQGRERIHGHHSGVHSVRDVVEGCGELGVGYLTLYAFSTENWNRPKAEVDALMELLVATIRGEVEELKKNNVRLAMIGDAAALPQSCREELAEAIALTSGGTGLCLILALSYSSRWELGQAAQRIAAEVAAGQLRVDEVNAHTLAAHLCTAPYPDPELMIRTSGEHRMSNFLLYQMAYTELYFTEVPWPEFRKKDLHLAIEEYNCRERRFGKTSEQIQEEDPTKK